MLFQGVELADQKLKFIYYFTICSCFTSYYFAIISRTGWYSILLFLIFYLFAISQYAFFSFYLLFFHSFIILFFVFTLLFFPFAFFSLSICSFSLFFSRVSSQQTPDLLPMYTIPTAAATEVEVDLLTGQHQVNYLQYGGVYCVSYIQGLENQFVNFFPFIT
jgi:hypothetical protein